MIDVDGLMNKFCELGAVAMHRYAEVSGELPDELPEYFMSSYILDHIGDGVISATLETVFSKLVVWNDDLRKEQGSPPRADKEKLLPLAEKIGKSRVDMVLVEVLPEKKWNYLALVEFKKGGLLGNDPSWNDRHKLLEILEHIDTCRYGVVCACVRGEARRDWDRKKVLNDRDRWYEREALPPSGNGKRYWFVVRLFENAASK